MAPLRLQVVAAAEAVAAAAGRVALPVADADRRLQRAPMLHRTASRLPRQLLHLLFRRPAARRLVAEQVAPVRLPQARHRQVVVAEADVAERCRQLQVPAVRPRAAASRTGPVMERSPRAS